MVKCLPSIHKAPHTQPQIIQIKMKTEKGIEEEEGRSGKRVGKGGSGRRKSQAISPEQEMTHTVAHTEVVDSHTHTKDLDSLSELHAVSVCFQWLSLDI